MLQPRPWRDLTAATLVRVGRKGLATSDQSDHTMIRGISSDHEDQAIITIIKGVLAGFPMSIYVGPCPSLGTSCSTCLIVTNRSLTSRCTTTISCYQTRLASSLLTPSRDTHTYRRSLPTYQSRNTLNTLKDECLYVRKGPYPKCIRKRTTTTNHGRRTGQRS